MPEVARRTRASLPARCVAGVLVAALVAAPGCASIPHGRWGVADVSVEGLERLDDAALESCLGTRRRGVFGLDFGDSSERECGAPPFDGGRLRVDMFSWPWTEWPLFDPSVFERDRERIGRWLRARGYYDGRLVEAHVDPAAALGEVEGAEAACPSESSGCEVRVRFRVEEGEPVVVRRVELHGLDGAPPEIRGALREALPFRGGDVFDEARFAEAQAAMIRALADRSYVDAEVHGEAKIDRGRHEAYVAFEVRLGIEAVLGRICVYGNGPLPAVPILGATYLEPGQPFSLDALEEAQRAIYTLGTLSSVEIRRRPYGAPSPTAAGEEGDADDEDGESEGAGPEAAGGASGDADAATTSDASEADLDEIETTTTVPDPEPLRDEDAGAGDAEPASSAVERPSLCLEPREGDAPEGRRVVDLEIHTTPGRMFRAGIGIGIQAGNTATIAGTSSAVSSSSLAALSQWDFHALLVLEDRNLFGEMLRVRLEERPRVIFPAAFPGGEARPGNQVSLSVRWPAFLEPRTVLFASIVHDYGPAPLVNFFRHELDGRIGLERAWLLGRTHTLGISAAVRGNLFLPDEDQRVRVDFVRERTSALILEESAYLDLRDNPRDPHEGAFFSIGLQQGGFGGISSWDYLRIAAEARGYISLPAGIVLAGRLGIGVMEVLGAYALSPDNVYQLAYLGPFSEQLSGGGASSNRGFPAGYLGDVELRAIELRPLPDGSEGARPPVLISGGVRRWELTLELRIPITPDIGIVLFADAGDVTRRAEFRLDHPQISPGFGLRLRTFIGTFRLDFGFRPDAIQVFGQDTRPAPCPAAGVEITRCRPIPLVFDSWWPGAIHLTIGEAF